MGIAEPPPRVRFPFAAILLAVMLAVTAGCGGSGDLPLDQVDPDAAPAVPTYDQVYAILQRACVSCHDDEELNLGNCVDIVAQRDGILETIDNDTMPTGALPRLTSVEKLLIRRWVGQGAVAPCN